MLSVSWVMGSVTHSVMSSSCESHFTGEKKGSGWGMFAPGLSSCLGAPCGCNHPPAPSPQHTADVQEEFMESAKEFRPHRSWWQGQEGSPGLSDPSHRGGDIRDGPGRVSGSLQPLHGKRRGPPGPPSALPTLHCDCGFKAASSAGVEAPRRLCGSASPPC